METRCLLDGPQSRSTDMSAGDGFVGTSVAVAAGDDDDDDDKVVAVV